MTLSESVELRQEMSHCDHIHMTLSETVELRQEISHCVFSCLTVCILSPEIVNNSSDVPLLSSL